MTDPMTRFAAAMVVDPELFLEAQLDPEGAAARFGISLTDEQAARIRELDPDTLEQLYRQLAFWPWEGGSFW